MTFTARKEQRPGGWYWYAYRRSQGKLHNVYLGKTEELTLERLNTTAEALERAGEALTGGTHRSLQAFGDNAVQVQQASIIAFPTTLAVAEQLSEPEPAPKHNLPVQLTSLIGREQDAASAVALLRKQEVRLLTMSGTAGIGKTRLALQVATDLLEDFADGVSFVSLAPINDPNLVLPTMAQTLGLKVSGNETIAERLSAFLQKKHLLLVLDNFEQVMAAASDLAPTCGTAILSPSFGLPRPQTPARQRHPRAVPSSEALHPTCAGRQARFSGGVGKCGSHR